MSEKSDPWLGPLVEKQSSSENEEDSGKENGLNKRPLLDRKWVLLMMTVIVIINFSVNSESAIYAAISSLVSSLLIVAVVWVFLFAMRYLQKTR